MDPLSVLSVACAVVQFVDAACTITKKCKEVYGSAGGSTERNAELSAYSERLETYLSSLKAPTSGTAPHGVLVLQQKCLITAGKLQDAIRKTNVILPAKGRQRLVRALLGTARSLWWEKDIADIEKKLQGYRVELDEHILKEVYDNIQKNLPQIQDRLSTLTEDQRRMVDALLSGQKSVEGMMGSIDRLTDQVQQLKSSLQQREEEKAEQVRAEQLRASLQFPNLSQRQTRIRKQGEGTFAWLLEDSKPSQPDPSGRPTLEYALVDWLSGDDRNLYWIWGKAGSGKSTLMKMLCTTERSRVTGFLRDWSSTQSVLLPAYFFWRSGDSDQQKSIQGLLQTLLFRIVEGAHDLTVDLVDPADETWSLTSDGWAVEQLEGALRRILARQDRPHICFFIDGLDEIAERPEELISIVRTMCGYDRVKVCVSSRPEFEYVEFVNTLGRLPHLRLEVINAVDIATFTDSKLRSVASGRDDLSDLAGEIKSHAQGVFIWVDYVIQYMTAPIKQGESIEDLMARLEHTPKKVDELYEAMFKDMGDFELRETAMLFRLALLPDTFIDVATCIVMLHQDKLHSPTHEFSNKLVHKHLENFAQRLQSRCHGLLEPVKRKKGNDTSETVGSDHMLQFTHRTAAAFAKKALNSGTFPPVPLESTYQKLCQAAARLLYASAKDRYPVTAKFPSKLRKPYIKYDPSVTEIFAVKRSHLVPFFSWCRLAYPSNGDLVTEELDNMARRMKFGLVRKSDPEYPDTLYIFQWAALMGVNKRSEHVCLFDALCVIENLLGPVSRHLTSLTPVERREAYTYLLAVATLLFREGCAKPFKRSLKPPSEYSKVDDLYTEGPASPWQLFLTTLVDINFLRVSLTNDDARKYQSEFHGALKKTTTAFLAAGANVMDIISIRYVLEEWNYEQHENGVWTIYIDMSATLALCILFTLLGYDDSFWNDLCQYMPSDEPPPAIVSSIERHPDPAKARKQGRVPLWQWSRSLSDRGEGLDRAIGSVLNARPVSRRRIKPQTVTWLGGTQPYTEVEELVSFTNLLKRMQAQDRGEKETMKSDHVPAEEKDDIESLNLKIPEITDDETKVDSHDDDDHNDKVSSHAGGPLSILAADVDDDNRGSGISQI